jgi:hypothetical protein
MSRQSLPTRLKDIRNEIRHPHEPGTNLDFDAYDAQGTLKEAQHAISNIRGDTHNREA